jgi:hypothetical protein
LSLIPLATPKAGILAQKNPVAIIFAMRDIFENRRIWEGPLG